LSLINDQNDEIAAFHIGGDGHGSLAINRCLHRILCKIDQRLFELIERCASSVHDLSRVELSLRRPRVPRFNMPFELGLAVALSLSKGTHRWYLLEARDYRLQASLSDMNGFDPQIHHGTPTGILTALTNAFVKPGGQPTVGDLKRLY